MFLRHHSTFLKIMYTIHTSLSLNKQRISHEGTKVQQRKVQHD